MGTRIILAIAAGGGGKPKRFLPFVASGPGAELDAVVAPMELADDGLPSSHPARRSRGRVQHGRHAAESI
jgi:hypothetical protein